ncbi:MAG: hypothetical protein JOZ98_21155 [Solirubrobacterales bacterium]|nr:hypothetical protein [Solirubrobacterales bacterium]
MVTGLITLPLRFGVRASLSALRAAEDATGLALRATGQIRTLVLPGGSRGAEPPGTPDGPVTVARPGSTPAPSGIEAQPDAAPLVSEPEPPAHVSEEPELVSEVAEPGAEDGAGASVTVDEPWTGYSRLSAKEIIDRLSSATAAELAAIELYESGNRGRATVLAAAERELKIKSGRGSVN